MSSGNATGFSRGEDVKNKNRHDRADYGIIKAINADKYICCMRKDQNVTRFRI